MIMANQENAKKFSLGKKSAILLITIVALVVILATYTVLTSIMPVRSVAAFCKVAKERKTILNTDVSYDKRLDAYRSLEAVSPDDIRPDIETIRKGYESIVQNPSNTISAGMGMSGAENRRTDYITKNCTDF